MAPPTQQQWTLLDQSSHVAIESLEVTPDDVGGSASDYHIRQQRLPSGYSEGVDVVAIDNGRLKFSVLPTRGLGLWKAALGKGPGSADEPFSFGWQSPQRGPVHPRFVPLSEPSGLGWLDGFDELMVRCGLESNGAPEHDENGQLLYPLHGRIANKPAHFCELLVDGDSGMVQLKGSVEETRFHFMKVRMNTTITTQVGSSQLTIRDEVENLSASPTEIQMLYHTNFGVPLLDAGSQFVAPVKSVVPRNARASAGIAQWDHYGAPTAGFEEQVYFLELFADEQDRTQAMLKNAHATHAAVMTFNKRQLPCFTVWKNTTATQDGYVTGLEPGTNFPNPRTFEGEQGRVAQLDGEGKIVFELTLEFFDNPDDITEAEEAIKAQQQEPVTIYDQPQPGWCA